MNAIVTVDNNFSVSLKNKPLASIPAEKKTMLSTVSGKTIVYDVHFLSELPGLQPVKGCRNYIYLDGSKGDIKGAFCYESIDDLKKALEKEADEEVYIIHGASLYNAFYDDIDTFHVTKIDYEYNADASIPDLDRDEAFSITADSDEMYCFDIIYNFLRYERRAK
ncbi:MAG: dihydrofolate reductase [Lachnospiraceae bacterium]|nr:dihydrofolate reductase [Lachnospiraceae bacterium]